MSSPEEIARLLNLGGHDGNALAEVMTDYFGDYDIESDSDAEVTEEGIVYITPT